jgi:Smr domain
MMKFQIGDKVTVLHSNEDGIVIDIINEKMVMVEVRDVRFPAYTDQLDYPYFKQFSQQKIVPEKKKVKQYIDDVKKEKKDDKPKLADGVWLSFLPVFDTDEFGDEVVEDIKLYLSNRTHDGYKFEYEASYSGVAGFELRNEVYAFNDFYLHDIPFENLNDSPKFEFAFSLITPNKLKQEEHMVTCKIKPKQLFDRIEALKQNGEATFSVLLFQDYPDYIAPEKLELTKLEQKGYHIYDASKARRPVEEPVYEIDLHIERLTDRWQYMPSGDILAFQMQTFEKYFDLALLNYQPTMTVIHGIGTGRLRDDIHEFLKYRKEVRSFVNQHHPRYGFGATEIFFAY